MNWRALLVEDRIDWQSILSRTLMSMGGEVDVASNFRQALALLEHTRYDLAVVDPVLDNANKYNRDGVRVINEIQQRYPTTPLIVVSGSVSHISLPGSDDLLRKFPIIEKQTWNKEAFVKLAQDALHGVPLPARHIDRAESVITSTQEMPVAPVDGERKGVPRILIVEDRPDWQVILSRTIEEEGWFWRTVRDAGEALHILREEKIAFNIVLLDLRLGDANIPLQHAQGWQLLDYLTSADLATQVIIVSGEASRGDVATLFMKYSISGFVDKDSFHKYELIGLIRKLTASAKLRIQTLGDFRLWRNGEIVDDFGESAVETLLKILMTRRGAPVSVDELADLMKSESVAAADLRPLINQMRMILEPNLAQPGDSSFIVREGSAYRFNFSTNVRVDFIELEEIQSEGKLYEQEHAYANAIKTYEKALRIYQGEYLPKDRFQQWSVQLRSHIQTKFAKTLNRLADLYARDGRLEEAIATAELCLKQDAYHEATYRRLMRYHACLGNKNTALMVYMTLEKLFREFFQEEPSAQTRELRDSIAAGEPVPCVEINRKSS
ncbi:MAG: response regulator [Anaerolineae bacterium]|nr:response regulator [Anaerolineae bacterium]